jgi:hypothetical protein
MLRCHFSFLNIFSFFCIMRSSRGEEALQAERVLAADKSNAQRGIIRWKYVRAFLHREGYLQHRGSETTVIDALR